MDDSAHVTRQYPLQVRLNRPKRAQIARTSTIAETDDSVLGRIIRFPLQLLRKRPRKDDLLVVLIDTATPRFIVFLKL